MAAIAMKLKKKYRSVDGFAWRGTGMIVKDILQVKDMMWPSGHRDRLNKNPELCIGGGQ